MYALRQISLHISESCPSLDPYTYARRFSQTWTTWSPNGAYSWLMPLQYCINITALIWRSSAAMFRNRNRIKRAFNMLLFFNKYLYIFDPEFYVQGWTPDTDTRLCFSQYSAWGAKMALWCPDSDLSYCHSFHSKSARCAYGWKKEVILRVWKMKHWFSSRVKVAYVIWHHCGFSTIRS